MRFRLLGGTVALGVLLLARPSTARDLFSIADPLGARRSATSEFVRARLVEVSDDVVWLRASQPGDELTLELFPDVKVSGVLERRIEHSSNSISWHGPLHGGGEFLLTLHGGVLVGQFSTPSALFELRYAGQGRHELREVRGDGDDGCEVIRPPLESLEPPPSGRDTRDKSILDDGSVIDVLVVYTEAAKIAEGGQFGIEALVVSAMDQTNIAYSQSGIAPQVRLVGMEEVYYVESGVLLDDLYAVTTMEGQMDEVWTMRDAAGADLVSLFVATGDNCGIAHLMGSLSPGYQYYAYSVVRTACIANLSFPHELGHNLGCCHAAGDGGGCLDGGVFTFSVGHRWLGISGTQWRSVMAYTPGIRIPHFSNPETLYDGVATGVPIGQQGEADNAATIDSTAFTVANYRRAVCDDVVAPSVTMNAPSGGIVVCEGAQETVSWTCSDPCIYNYSVELSIDGGSTWSLLGAGFGSGTSGSFPWMVQNGLGENGLVRVTIENDAGTASDSRSFQVDAIPAAVLQSFTGGETVCAVGYSEILWENDSTCGVEATSWSIEYSTDAGGSWSEIAAGAGTGGGSYAWLVPDTPTSQGRVRVILSNAAGVDSTSSSSNFTILPSGAPSVVVQSPNGGEVWPVGSQQLISWTNNGCGPAATTIRYSTDGGVSFTVEHTEVGVDPGSYLWTVPWIDTDQAVVSVEQFSGGGSDLDISDATFSILIPPQPSLQVPIGGEVWVEGSTHTVLWSNIGGSAASHTVEYSIDGGTNWTPIVQDVPGAGGSLDWTLPNSPTTYARVQVSLDNLAGTAVTKSPGNFTIDAQPVAVDPQTNLPAVYRLGAAAPNPFQRLTSIQLELPTANPVTLRVYNVAGRLVRTIENRQLGAGPHRATWDGRDSVGRDVAPGIYFVRMRAGDFTATRKLVRLK